MRAPAAAIRKSHAIASDNPPPIAKPFTAAIVTWSSRSHSSIARHPRRAARSRDASVWPRCACAPALAVSPPMSAPAQNDRPLPVRMTTRVSSSSWNSCATAIISLRSLPLIGLSFSGRLKYTVAIAPARSTAKFSYAIASTIPELLRRVSAEHPYEYRFFHSRACEDLDRLRRTRGVLMRIARSPNHLLSEVMRQLLYQPLFRIEAQHHVSLFPQLLGVGAHGIVMQQRYRAARGFHFLKHFLHPRRLAMRHHHFHLRIALHHGEADQGGRDEHMV